MNKSKNINELKAGDIIFVHPLHFKITKRCFFKKIHHIPSSHNFVLICYIDERGISDSSLINKKYLTKPASLTITTDDTEEAIWQMEISRKADSFKKRNFQNFRSEDLKKTH